MTKRLLNLGFLIILLTLCSSAHAQTATETCNNSTFASGTILCPGSGSMSVTSGDIIIGWIMTSLTIGSPTLSGTGCSTSTFSVIGTPANSQSAWTATASGTGTCVLHFPTSGGTNNITVGGMGAPNLTATTDGTPVYLHPGFCSSCTAGTGITTTAASDSIFAFITTNNSDTCAVSSPLTARIASGTGGQYVCAGDYVPGTTVSAWKGQWTIGSGGSASFYFAVALKSSTPTPTAGLSTSSLTFSSLNMNSTSASQSVTLTNSGTATLNLTSILLTTGTQFSMSNGSPSCPVGSGGGTVAASATCIANVVCTPLGIGTITDTMTFTYSNNTPSTQTVSLTCTGKQPAGYSMNGTAMSGQRSSAPNTLQVMSSGTRIGSTVPGQIAFWNGLQTPSGALNFTTVQHPTKFNCTGTGTVTCALTVTSTTAGNLGLLGIHTEYTGTGFPSTNWALNVTDNGTAELWTCDISSMENNNQVSQPYYNMQYCYVPSLAGGATTITVTASLTGLTGSPAGKVNVRFLEATPSYKPIYYNLGTSLYSNTSCTACAGPVQSLFGGASGVISQSTIFPAASVASVNSPYTNFDADATNNIFSGFADSLSNTSWSTATWNEGGAHNPNYFNAISFTANATPALSVPMYQNFSTCTNNTAMSSQLSCLTSSTFSNFVYSITNTGGIGAGMTSCNSTLSDALPSTINANGSLYTGTESGTLNMCGTTAVSGTNIGAYTILLNATMPMMTAGFTAISTCPASAGDCGALSRITASGSTNDYITPHFNAVGGHTGKICSDLAGVGGGICPDVPGVTYAPSTAYRFSMQLDTRPPFNWGTATFTNGNPTISLLNNFVVGQALELTTTGSLPTGFATSTVYYVINPTSTTVQLSATSGGTAITPSSAGSGTQTAVFEPTNILVVCNPGVGGSVLGTVSHVALAGGSTALAEILNALNPGINGEEPTIAGYSYVQRDFTYGFPISTSACY